MIPPAERSLRGRIGAYSLHAKHDTRQLTHAARQAFLTRFLADIPTELPEEERLRRAQAARQAYFARLALKSIQARRRRRQRRQEAAS